MRKTSHLSRPATSAIAAFLVLSTPAAFAQTASAPTTPAPATTSAPEPAPVQSTAQPSAPVVMVPPVAPTTTTAPAPSTTVTAPAAPVIRVPLTIEPPVEATSPAPDVAPAPAPKAEKVTERSAPAPTERQATAAPAAAAAESAPSEMSAEAQPIPDTPPVMAPVDGAAEPTPLPAERADATTDAFPWEIAGGAAVLLLAGGAAFAFARRRRTPADEAVVYEAPLVAAPPEPVAPRAERPLASAPQMRSTPAFAAAPHGSMGRHEAMALTGPSEDNPFLTLKKRLKRARFYDRRERLEYEGLLAGQEDMRRKPASAWDIAQRPEPAAAEQEVRRPEPAASRGMRGLRPGYAGS